MESYDLIQCDPKKCDGMDVKMLDARVFERAECVVYSGGGNIWETGNSKLISSPVLDVHRLLGSKDFAQSAASMLVIEGPLDEPLHVHHSHILGLAVKGRGWLEMPDGQTGTGEGKTRRIAVNVGDVVVIPRHAPHLFQCDPNGYLELIAVEYSNQQIDYQKHIPADY